MVNFLGPGKGVMTPLPLTETKIKEIFKRHDVNRDGVLNKNEIVTAFKELGAWFPSFRAYGGLGSADGNKDGVIDENELEDVVKYAFKLGYTVK